MANGGGDGGGGVKKHIESESLCMKNIAKCN